MGFWLFPTFLPGLHLPSCPCCRRLIAEMEAKQQSERLELQRLQQEVESQRRESQQVHQRILQQEESLRQRSQDIESRLRDFLELKQRFEDERRCHLQGLDVPASAQVLREIKGS